MLSECSQCYYLRQVLEKLILLIAVLSLIQMQIPDHDMVVDNYDNGQDNSDRADVVLVSPSGSPGSPEEPEPLRADDCKPSFAHLLEIRSIQTV